MGFTHGTQKSPTGYRVARLGRSGLMLPTSFSCPECSSPRSGSTALTASAGLGAMKADGSSAGPAARLHPRQTRSGRRAERRSRAFRPCWPMLGRGGRCSASGILLPAVAGAAGLAARALASSMAPRKISGARAQRYRASDVAMPDFFRFGLMRRHLLFRASLSEAYSGRRLRHSSRTPRRILPRRSSLMAAGMGGSTGFFCLYQPVVHQRFLNDRHGRISGVFFAVHAVFLPKWPIADARKAAAWRRRCHLLLAPGRHPAGRRARFSPRSIEDGRPIVPSCQRDIVSMSDVIYAPEAHR